MAQRKNKDRKEKLVNYKKTHKMSKAPEMKPFRQVPTWQANDNFEISGTELDALYQYFQVFAPAFTAVQSVFSRGVQSEKIKIGYEYEDGTPVSDEEVKDYTNKLNAYFKQKLEAEKGKEGTAEDRAVASKILDSFGSPAEVEEQDISQDA